MFNPNCVYLLGLTCLFSSNSNFIRIVIQIRYISSIHQFFLIFWCSDLFLKLFEIQDGELKLAGSWWRIQDSGQFGIWDVIWLFVALCLACIVITKVKIFECFTHCLSFITIECIEQSLTGNRLNVELTYQWL